MTNYQQYSNDLVVGLLKLPQSAADRFCGVIEGLKVPLSDEYTTGEQIARKRRSKSVGKSANKPSQDETAGDSVEN